MSHTMINKTFRMLIDGELLPGRVTYPVINPATELVFAEAPDCTPAELDQAVVSARKALKGWRHTSIDKRREKLQAFAQTIADNVDELSQLLMSEQGKPLQAAKEDILGGAHWLQETTKLDLPSHVSEDTSERLTVTTYEPIGVVAGIVPWNYPIMLAMFKLAPALLAGNTMILKPAPTTPLTTLRIAELARENFPQGVLNVISGQDNVGPLLTEHSGIDKISFTGSTATGKQVMASAAATLKRITLELGGNDAGIVMPDVDIDRIVESVFWGAFTNAGQVCICTKRLYIHQDIYEPFRSALVSYAQNIIVGDGSDSQSHIGPVQNQKQYDRIVGLIQDARSNGYAFSIGGEVPESSGYFLPISILDNPPEDSRIVAEEQFGPILPLLKFESTEEVIRRVNQSEYGLGATIWSGDLEAASQIAGRLDVGSVWINEGQQLSPYASFGGHKQSGIGVECGLDGLLEYTLAKTIFTGSQSVNSSRQSVHLI